MKNQINEERACFYILCLYCLFNFGNIAKSDELHAIVKGGMMKLKLQKDCGYRPLFLCEILNNVNVDASCQNNKIGLLFAAVCDYESP